MTATAPDGCQGTAVYELKEGRDWDVREFYGSANCNENSLIIGFEIKDANGTQIPEDDVIIEFPDGHKGSHSVWHTLYYNSYASSSFEVKITEVASGCSFYYMVAPPFEKHFLEAIAPQAIFLCGDDEPAILQAPEIEEASYSWQLDGAEVATTANYETTIPGQYTLRVSKAGYCDTNGEVEVVEVGLTASLTNSGDDFCNGPIQLSINAEGSDYLNYEWSTGEEVIEIMVAKLGDFSVTITDLLSACTLTKNITIDAPVENIEELEIAPDPIVYCSENQPTLSVSVLPEWVESYQWKDPNEALHSTPELLVEGQGMYELQVLSKGGCNFTKTIHVGDPEDASSIAQSLDEAGFICFPITVTATSEPPAANSIEPRSSGETTNLAPGAAFRFAAGSEVSSEELASQIDGFLGDYETCLSTHSGLITDNVSWCAEDVESLGQAADGELLMWMHILDNEGPDDCLMVKAIIPGDPSFAKEEERAILFHFEKLMADASTYGYAGKSENLLAYSMNMVVGHSIDTIIITDFSLSQPDNTGLTIDVQNLLFDLDCRPTWESLGFLAPSGSALGFDKGAKIRFITEPNKLGVTPQGAVKGFTIENGEQQGIWQGMRAIGCPELFTRYRHIYSNKNYQNSKPGLIDGKAFIWVGINNQKSCPQAGYNIYISEIDPDHPVMSEGNSGYYHSEARGTFLDEIPEDFNHSRINFFSRLCPKDATVDQFNNAIKVEFTPPEDQKPGGNPAGWLYHINIGNGETLFVFAYLAPGENVPTGYAVYNICTGLWEVYDPPSYKADYLDNLTQLINEALQLGGQLALETASIVLDVIDWGFAVYYWNKGEIGNAILTSIPLVGDVIGYGKILWKYGDEFVQGMVFTYRSSGKVTIDILEKDILDEKRVRFRCVEEDGVCFIASYCPENGEDFLLTAVSCDYGYPEGDDNRCAGIEEYRILYGEYLRWAESNENIKQINDLITIQSFDSLNRVNDNRLLKQVELVADYSIRPNPFSDQMILQITAKIEEEVTLLVFNDLGQKVIMKKLPVFQGENKTIIPSHDLLPGIYFVKLLGKNNTFSSSKRMVKFK